MDLNKNGKDDIEELKDAAGAFISDVTTTIEQDIHFAIDWLKDELAKIGHEGQALLKAAVQEALGSAEAGRPIGEVVADTLTVLARDAAHLIEELSSDAITAVVGLTTAKPNP